MSSTTTEEPRAVDVAVVETIVDIDCDLPLTKSVLDLEDRARQLLREEYPETRHRIADGASALQFATGDGKRIVQFRADGYSFNCLEPCAGPDAHLAQIESTWRVFRELASPVQIRSVRWRSIRRFSGSERFFRFFRGASLPVETLQFQGFVNHYSAVDAATGYRVNATLVTQPPEDGSLTVISDIESADSRSRALEDWSGVQEAILSLERLTDRVFEGTLART